MSSTSLCNSLRFNRKVRNRICQAQPSRVSWGQALKSSRRNRGSVPIYLQGVREIRKLSPYFQSCPLEFKSGLVKVQEHPFDIRYGMNVEGALLPGFSTSIQQASPMGKPSDQA